MKYLSIYFVLVSIVFFACSEEADATLGSEEYVLKSSKNKGILICHQHSPNGLVQKITIDENDWPQHENHGDVRLDDQDGDSYYPDNGCKYFPMGDCDDQNQHLHPGVEHEVILDDGTSIFVHPYSDYTSRIWSPDYHNFLPMDYNNGLINTTRLVNYYDSQKKERNTYAAGYCYNLSNDNCTWYLPSNYELIAMYEQLGPTDNGHGGQGIMTEGWYWTSIQSSLTPNQAVGFEMGSWTLGTFARATYQLRCKCVRR